MGNRNTQDLLVDPKSSTETNKIPDQHDLNLGTNGTKVGTNGTKVGTNDLTLSKRQEDEANLIAIIQENEKITQKQMSKKLDCLFEQ